jgi:hypothetical protein
MSPVRDCIGRPTHSDASRTESAIRSLNHAKGEVRRA